MGLSETMVHGWKGSGDNVISSSSVLSNPGVINSIPPSPQQASTKYDDLIVGSSQGTVMPARRTAVRQPNTDRPEKF
jgi:hypothetical protein